MGKRNGDWNEERQTLWKWRLEDLTSYQCITGQKMLTAKTPSWNSEDCEVWMIFIFISSYLVPTLSVLQMKWTVSGETILRTNLTWLCTTGVGHLGQSNVHGRSPALFTQIQVRCDMSSFITERFLSLFKKSKAGWGVSGPYSYLEAGSCEGSQHHLTLHMLLWVWMWQY